MCWVCQNQHCPPSLGSRIQESPASRGCSISSHSRCPGRCDLPRQTGCWGWAPEEGRAALQEPGQLWMLLAGAGRALGKRICRNWLPQHFLSDEAEKCWHRLGEQPGLCEQTQELERRFLVATVDVWEKENVCVLNKYWHSARAYQLTQCFSSWRAELALPH